MIKHPVYLELFGSNTVKIPAIIVQEAVLFICTRSSDGYSQYWMGELKHYVVLHITKEYPYYDYETSGQPWLNHDESSLNRMDVSIYMRTRGRDCQLCESTADRISEPASTSYPRDCVYSAVVYNAIKWLFLCSLCMMHSFAFSLRKKKYAVVTCTMQWNCSHLLCGTTDQRCTWWPKPAENSTSDGAIRDNRGVTFSMRERCLTTTMNQLATKTFKVLKAFWNLFNLLQNITERDQVHTNAVH